MQTPKLFVVVEGASIMAIVSSDPAFIGMDIHVIDYDAAEEPQAADINVTQSDGTSAPAFYRAHTVEASDISIPDGAEPRR